MGLDKDEEYLSPISTTEAPAPSIDLKLNFQQLQNGLWETIQLRENWFALLSHELQLQRTILFESSDCQRANKTDVE